MVRIEIVADEQLFAALNEVAKRRATTVEALAQSALREIVAGEQNAPCRYSFLGIASSAGGNLSQSVDEQLADANPREGWSLPE